MDFAIVSMQCQLPGSPDVDHWMRATSPALSPVPESRWQTPRLNERPGTPDCTVSLVGGWVEDLNPQKVVADVLDQARARPEKTELFLANLSLPSPAAVDQVAKGQQPTHSEQRALDLRHFFRLKQASALDAACASGLYAVRLAMDALATGRCELAVAAGVQACDPSYLLIGFSQLLALSPTGTPFPLDRRANGLVVGEGCAAVGLMRLDDALRTERTIHGVLRGGGLGNDGRKGNTLAPDATGQLRTMQAAWASAGLDPRTAGYFECHATGTQKGDGTELSSLTQLLKGGRGIAVGSAKGLIGHTITSAGLAGLLRAVGAVRDGRIPAGPREPLAGIEGVLRSSPGEAWGGKRRAGVSAFGFGGTNAHLIVDSPPAKVRRPAPAPTGRFGIRSGLRKMLRGEPAPAQVPQVPRQRLVKTPRLSITGVAAQRGTLRNGPLYDALRTGESVDGPLQIEVGARRWRIPPHELAEMLPQQLLALELAGDALQASGHVGSDVAVILGMSLSAQPCQHVLAWRGEGEAPPLTAQRVQGQLPNFVANRVSGQLALEGPSYTVSAGGMSGIVAITQAAQLIGAGVQAVIVGAVDEARGGIVFVLEPARPDCIAELDFAPASTVHEVGSSPIAGLEPLLAALCGTESVAQTLSGPAGELSLVLTPRRSPHAILSAGMPAPGAEVTAPTALTLGPGLPSVQLEGPVSPVLTRIRWTASPGATSTALVANAPEAPEAVGSAGSVSTAHGSRSAPPAASPRSAGPATSPTASVRMGSSQGGPGSMAAATPARPISPAVVEALGDLQQLTAALARQQEQLVTVHERFLTSSQEATAALARLGMALGSSVPRGRREEVPVGRPGREVLSDFPRGDAVVGDIPRVFDHAALVRHAQGTLSSVFGARFADQDGFEPRTRMPMAPLLLCTRVLEIEGTPLELGPARIVTEYDLPTDANWSHHDGKPNACVIVESGQADLFLVSWLGIEQHARGERVYRLLDCDLEFHGPRPSVGETLHHDIRIKSFARLGSKILFYFEYDCTSNTDGRPVLSMRNGVAGFFTPGELAVPQGVDPTPRDHRAVPLSSRHRPPAALDATGVDHLVHGRFSAALGASYVSSDGSRLTLPDSEWRLVHEVEAIALQDGPHGLGFTRTLQVLRDDDWFNPCHFKGDPCMPGTLMLEGCLQAVQVWLLAAGVAADHPDGLFEPLPGLPMELRCRGQVVPGHSRLTYEARIHEADLGPTPYAVADVLLSVDGTPVVLARNVGVTVGRRGHVASEPVTSEPVVDVRRIYEYSIGDAERAFGPRYREHAALSPRCARMPGPPLLQMTRVQQAEEPFVVRQGSEVVIDYEVPPRAWYFDTTPGTSMPFAILLETALQPCGWLTAWEAAGIKDGRNLFFRNLGGTATQHVEIWPDAGTLTTRTKQTSVAESAGLLIHRFELEVTCGSTPVYSCTTSFGYFTAAALDGQKGLPLRDKDRRTQETEQAPAVQIDITDHPSMPRDDWRNLDRVIRRNDRGGRENLGWYVAEKRIDPSEWFFTAHFFLDPVMPGSLGLEAALQLARWVLEERTGHKERLTPIRIGVPHSWKYRGQMRRPVERMTIELEVTALSDTEIVFDAVLRADGLPIYELTDFGMTSVPARVVSPPPALPARGPHAAALLDSFTVEGHTGTGVLRLDPARFPWLRDHCPTLTAPAVPLAFAAEIAAEAASLVRPGSTVIGLPQLRAERWIHTGDGPIDLLVVAVADGDLVSVSLAVHVHNPRFPKLSGPKVHMSAIVQTGATWHPAPPVRSLRAPRVPMSVEDYYAGGLTFHGPTLQGMIDLGIRSDTEAEATFQTRPDADLNGPGLPFVLDPLLLDTATHPMVSGEPQLWNAALGEGFLAYPVAADDLRLHGPRPRGQVRCQLHKVAADAQQLCFDVVLIGSDGPWCSFRWTEAIVPGGPVLGQPTAIRKAFIWEGVPHPQVQIGRQVGNRFRVEEADLIEPIEGTLVGLCCTERELRSLRQATDRTAWTLGRLAAKGAARTHVAARLRDIHPRDLEMLDMRPDRYLVVDSPALTAQELIDNLGPTRFHLNVHVGTGFAEAWLTETGWPT